MSTFRISRSDWAGAVVNHCRSTDLGRKNWLCSIAEKELADLKRQFKRVENAYSQKSTDLLFKYEDEVNDLNHALRQLKRMENQPPERLAFFELKKTNKETLFLHHILLPKIYLTPNTQKILIITQ